MGSLINSVKEKVKEIVLKVAAEWKAAKFGLVIVFLDGDNLGAISGPH